jgi:hypothetical protein
LPDKQLQQSELGIRTVSVPTDPLLAALFSATAPTGAAPAPTLPAPRPAIADDVLPWERPEAQESH